MFFFRTRHKEDQGAWHYDFFFNGRRYRGFGGATRAEAFEAQEKLRARLVEAAAQKDPRDLWQ